jgi:AcrR family transcriptional regulator
MTVDINDDSMSTDMDMKATRTYTMTARARASEATRRRVVEAVIAAAGEIPFAEITLDAVAARAGVSVKTVLRHYGSRDGLLAAAAEVARAETEAERRVVPGDTDAAMRSLLDHYERRGRTALLMLAQEGHDEVARTVTDQGKALHRDWVRAVFAPQTDDEAVLDLLVVATDVYTWKLLRLDREHSRAVTERRMRELVLAVLDRRPT